MTTTPFLGIPLLVTQQQQPNVTHNEALFLFQALLNGVVSRGSNTPPSSPSVGHAHIVGTSPTGVWASRANSIAIYTDGGWRFVPGNDNDGTPIAMDTAQEGLNVYSRADDALYVWSGSAWVEFTGGGAVDSVNGETGIVVLDADDVGAIPALTSSTGWQVVTYSDGEPDASGTTIAAGATSNTVAYRGTGGVLQVGTPTVDAHATTKLYVDDRFGDLGTAALKNTGTSGDAVPLLNGVNTWSGVNHFSTNIYASYIGDAGDNSAARSMLFEFPNISTVEGIVRVGAFTNTSSPSGTGLYIYNGDGTGNLSSAFDRSGFYSPVTYASTTADAANVVIYSNGQMARSVSAAKYKTDVEDAELDYALAFLEARPVWYRSLCDGDSSDHSFWGFIAEELAEIDPRLVHWGRPTKESESGLPEPDMDAEPVVEGVQYERIPVMHHLLIQKLFEEIEALKNRLSALEDGA